MKRTVWFAMILALAATNASAWDHFGHMVVAALAYDRLDPPVREKVDALVRLNPMYAGWVQDVPAGERGKTAFEMAARWPDLIKADPGYQDDGENPQGPDAALNIGYADKRMHKYWHYIDLPFSTDGSSTFPPKTPNAQTRIADFRQVVGSASAAPELQSYDLAWLLHLVGDVHQPLHATSRFTHDLPGGDEGGNKVRLAPCDGCEKVLHAYWDDVLGTGTSPADAAVAAAAIAPAPDDAAADLDQAHWVQESFVAAQRYAYAGPSIGAGGKGPYKLTEQYQADAKSVATQRVALAGARLANLLNQLLK
jgi:hypothetical protein